MLAVGFGEDAGVEDDDVAFVAMAADESPDALTEAYDGIGYGEFGEGVAALHTAMFASGFADGMTGVLKGEAGDDDLGKGGAGNVDSGPEAVGAEEDAVAGFSELVGEFGAGVVVSLSEEGALDFFEKIGAAFANLAQVEMAGEKDEGSAFDAAAAPTDHIGEVVEVEASGSGFGEGGVVGDQEAGVLRVVKGGGLELGFGGFGADLGLEAVEVVTVGKGGAGEDCGGVSTEEGFTQFRRDVEGGAAQGDELAVFTAAFEPVDMAFLGEGDETADGVAIAEEAVAVVAEFVLLAFVVGFLDVGGEAFSDGLEGAAEDVLAELRLVETSDGLLGEEGVVEVTEEFVVGGEGFFDGGEVVGIAFFFKGSAAGLGVVESAEGAVDGVVAEVDAEVVGGDGGDAVGFVEDDEVVGQEDAGFIAAGGHAGVDEGEEEAVVNDDAVCVLELLAGALVEAGGGVAVFTGTGGTVGIDGVPDIGEGLGREFLDDAVGACRGPFGEADEVVFFVVGEEVGLPALGVFKGVLESGGATVIAAPNHKGGLEFGVGMKFGEGFKEGVADFEILAADLFLKGDGMAGDNAGSRGANGVNETGDEVGEAFAHSGAGLEEEGFAGLEGIGDGEGHGVLLGAVVELEDGLEVPAFFEDGLDEWHEVTRDGGAAAVFDKTNHSSIEEH